MPEADGAIAGASDESSQLLVSLQLFCLWVALEADLEVGVDLLNVVYGTIVRVESTHDMRLLDFIIVP